MGESLFVPSSQHASCARSVAILSYGQTARGSIICSATARLKQMWAIQYQMKIFSRLGEVDGIGIALYLATNDCGGAWGNDLRQAYSPVLADMRLVDCGAKLEKDHKCMARAVFEMFDVASVGSYDMILLMRPDLEFKDPAGLSYGLVRGMLFDRMRATWPHRCEKAAWSGWQCVSDTMLAIPSVNLAEFRRSCFGFRSCLPELNITVGAEKRHFDTKGPKNDKWVTFSGHGCYRCARGQIPALKLGFAVNESRRVNPRNPAGVNPYYTFAEAHH